MIHTDELTPMGSETDNERSRAERRRTGFPRPSARPPEGVRPNTGTQGRSFSP